MDIYAGPIWTDNMGPFHLYDTLSQLLVYGARASEALWKESIVINAQTFNKAASSADVLLKSNAM
jgi:hypothetical protein